MTDLDFYAAVLATGTVLGLDETAETGAMAVRLGYDRAAGEAQAGDRFRLLGMLEFQWLRWRGRWHGLSFTVRVDHLRWGAEIPPALREMYGPFRGVLRFPELRDETAARGFPLEEIPSQPGWREFRQPDSGAGVWVVDEPAGQDDPWRPGDVHTIRAPTSPPAAPDGVPRRAIRDATADALRLPPDKRLKWLARRQPDGDARAGWWRAVFGSAWARIGGAPRHRAEWARFAVWLLRRAEADPPVPAAEIAKWRASLVAEVHDYGLAAEAGADLPPADEVVRGCLAALPMRLDDPVPEFTARALPPEIRRWQETRNLVDAAAPHLHRVADGELAERLRHWIAHRAAGLPFPAEIPRRS